MRMNFKRFLISTFLFLFMLSSTSALRAQGVEGYATPKSVVVGDSALLDPTDGLSNWVSDSLRVEWDWVSRPDLSVADLHDATRLRASFTPDVAGRYVARAQFFDANAALSTDPLHVVLVEASTGNSRPMARITSRATPQQTYPLQLDGTRSFDIDGDVLSYGWSVSGQESGLTGSFSDATDPMPVLSVRGCGSGTGLCERDGHA